MIYYIRKISPQSAIVKPLQQGSWDGLWGFVAGFCPSFCGEFFLLPSCQFSFYICVCSRNAKG